MDYKFNKNGDINILSLEGNLLGAAQTESLIDEINHKLEDNSNLFILDLGSVKFINSMGLSMLLTILTKARKAGGEVVLINIPEQLSKLLIITKLNAVFTIIDSMDLALETLNKNSKTS